MQLARKICAVVALVAGGLCAQTPQDFAMKIESVDANTARVVGSWSIAGVQGWSWGVCHDPAFASLGECVGQSYSVADVCSGACARITCPPDMLTLRNGAKPDFNTVNVYANGVLQGVVIDFMQVITMPVTARVEMLTLRYDLTAPWLNLEFCNTLGLPPTDVVVVVGGRGIAPAVQEKLGRPYPDMTLRLAQTTVQGKEAVEVLLDTPPTEAASGFSFGLAHDSTAVKVADLAAGTAIAAAGGADFWRVTIVEDKGVTLGCVIDLEPEGGKFRVLPAFTVGQQVAVAAYALDGGTAEVTTNVAFSTALGTPPVEVVVDVDGDTRVPIVGDPVAITVGSAPVAARFIRGDANQDGKVNIADAVAIVRTIFGVGSKIALIEACQASADVNDDGELNVSDVTFVLAYLFQAGRVIPAPAGVCGLAPEGRTITCEEFRCP